MTQHDKILEMHSDGAWHCQSEYWKKYIFSPHKRRGEIEDREDNEGNKLYLFQERPCIHGIDKSKDFLLIHLSKPTHQDILPPVEKSQPALFERDV